MMAAFSDASFSTSAFSTSAFGFDVAAPAAPSVAIDYTGAFGGRVKQDRTHREDIEKAIRYLNGEPGTAEEVERIVKPYVAPRKTERAPIRINWPAFQGDLAAVHQLLALYEQQLAADYARRLDEEDAEILLLL